MDKTITLRIDQETYEILEQLKKQYKINKSNIIRMAIVQLKRYLEKSE